MIQDGSVVKFSPKWSRPEERGYIFAVRNLHTDTGVCDIVCLNKRYSIGRYIETVSLDMIVDTGLTVEKDILPFDTKIK